MLRNPWFMLVVGLLIGILVGYIIAEELQQIPPAAMVLPTGNSLPDGHPPVSGSVAGQNQQEMFAGQVAELEAQVAEDADNPRPLIMLGNLHFDAQHWQAARLWYERALELEPENPDVLTDLAVVYRNLGQPERALELLEKASALRPNHPVTLYNLVVVYHFDLKQPEKARAALEKLKKLAEQRPDLDISGLEQEVLGSSEKGTS